MTDYVHRISDEERERIRRFVRMGAAITVLFVALVFVAVLTARHWATLISPDSERQFVRPHVAWLHRHILDESDPVLQDYVAGLGAELAADMGVRDDMELEFLVIEGSTINAFTTLGGYIFVFDGLRDGARPRNCPCHQPGPADGGEPGHPDPGAVICTVGKPWRRSRECR
jgi:hypothetical protein